MRAAGIRRFDRSFFFGYWYGFTYRVP